jgi:hypothetical protein
MATLVNQISGISACCGHPCERTPPLSKPDLGLSDGQLA